jgi:dihydroorotate dehydrogenase (NAD+) catalytic subunit
MTRMRITTERPGERPVPRVDLSTTLASVELPDPLLTASGCAASGRELDQFFDLAEIGAVVTKTIMLKARSGRATPRMAETPSGMLNSIGLQGPGIDAFIDQDLAWLRQRGARAIVSIGGSTVEEYAKLAQRLRNTDGVTAVEVNISCPNVEDRGQVFACDPLAAAAVIAAVRRSTAPGVPVLAKLSPDVTDIVAVARAVVDAGADAVSLINTSLGLVMDTDTLRPAVAGLTGGLSGPAIRPIAVRCVWQVHAALPQVPIVGIGGICTGLDALEFFLAGASAVGLGTVLFHDPSAPLRIRRELQVALADRGFDRLRDVIGLGHLQPINSEEGLTAEQDTDREPDDAPGGVAGDRPSVGASTSPTRGGSSE